MLELKDGVSWRTFCVHMVILLSFGAESELICSHQPIIALVGDDVILPCRINASSKIVMWTRPGLDPKNIHVYHDGRLIHRNQNPSYRDRTALFVDQLINGNVSLKLSSVRISDSGKYICFLPSIDEEASIQLTVGAVSSPVLTETVKYIAESDLRCESEGWYPEPELFWLDDEGNLVSAGPAESVRGPDGLFTVSSTVTVRRRVTNSIFTCRVQQKNINQTREANISVLGHFLTIVFSCVAIVLFAALLASFCNIWCYIKKKQRRRRRRRQLEDQRQQRQYRQQLEDQRQQRQYRQQLEDQRQQRQYRQQLEDKRQQRQYRQQLKDQRQQQLMGGGGPAGGGPAEVEDQQLMGDGESVL